MKTGVAETFGNLLYMTAEGFLIDWLFMRDGFGPLPVKEDRKYLASKFKVTHSTAVWKYKITRG